VEKFQLDGINGARFENCKESVSVAAFPEFQIGVEEQHFLRKSGFRAHPLHNVCP